VGIVLDNHIIHISSPQSNEPDVRPILMARLMQTIGAELAPATRYLKCGDGSPIGPFLGEDEDSFVNAVLM
jgi:hypothetical protein